MPELKRGESCLSSLYSEEAFAARKCINKGEEEGQKSLELDLECLLKGIG